MSGDECRRCGRLLDEFGQCWACDESGEALVRKARQEAGAVPASLPALSADALRAASAEVIRATAELERSARTLAEVRFELDTQEAALIAASVEGKNEGERRANLRLQLAEKYAELHGAETGVAGARADLDIAKIRLDALRYQLRLLEVQSGAPR